MERGAHQQSTPTTVFTGVVPRVRTPQVATSPATTREQAISDAGRQKLDQRLEAVLRGFVEGFACDAASFYELNSSSTHLVLRTEYHAAESEAAPERRPLATAHADVAAMAGSAIVLEDDVDVACWQVPVWCGAALCLPVSSDEKIHGTLWLYSREPRPFANAELQLAEVVAGRLAVELELNEWRRMSNAGGANSAKGGSNDPAPRPVGLSTASSPDSEVAPPPEQSPSELALPRLIKPCLAPQADDWELAGTVTANNLGAFYDWQTLADGRTLVASAAAGDDHHQSWLEAARIALRAHAAQSIDAGELLTYANHTLWLASPGGEGLAVAVALLDGDGARVSLAAAGGAGIARWRAATCDWSPASCPPLGWAERTVYTPKSVELVIRERLILSTTLTGDPSSKALVRLADKLRHNASNELRQLPGKRALRIFGQAATAVGIAPASMAMARRR